MPFSAWPNISGSPFKALLSLPKPGLLPSCRMSCTHIPFPLISVVSLFMPIS